MGPAKPASRRAKPDLTVDCQPSGSGQARIKTGLAGLNCWLSAYGPGQARAKTGLAGLNC